MKAASYELDYADSDCECKVEDSTVIVHTEADGKIWAQCGACGEHIDLVEVE